MKATLGISALASPNLLVEVEVDAILQDLDCALPRRTLNAHHRSGFRLRELRRVRRRPERAVQATSGICADDFQK